MHRISTFEQNDADFAQKKTTCGLQVVFLIVGVKIT